MNNTGKKRAFIRIFITGAAGGIGHALYNGYAARGDDVTGTTHNHNSDGWMQLDVTNPVSIAAMASQLEYQMLDLLICNADVYPDKSNELNAGHAANEWADIFATNVTGVFLTIEALLPNLQAAGGKVAIIAPQMGSSERTEDNAFASHASSAAVLNLGRNLSVALAPDVAVGVYHPGWTQTDMDAVETATRVNDFSNSLIQRIEALGPKNTGCFERWKRGIVPY